MCRGGTTRVIEGYAFGCPEAPSVVRSMKLTPQDQQAIARRAIWYFDCYFGMNHDDSVVFTGDGVDDLDALVLRLRAAFSQPGAVGVRSRFMCDVGTQYSSYKAFDIEDVLAIRAYFIEYYGYVNKPDAYAKAEGSAISV